MDYPNTPKGIRALCDHFTVEQLTDILGISERTARRYQSGESTPSRADIRLLALIKANRIMPDCWPDYFEFFGNELNTGMERVKWAQLANVTWVMQQWYITLNHIGDLERRIAALLPQIEADDAEQIKAAQQKLIKTRERPNYYQLQKKHWYRKNGC